MTLPIDFFKDVNDKVPATIPLPVVIVVVLALGGVVAGVIIKKRRAY